MLAVTGAAGLPPIESAGNVLRPMTSLKLSLRLPPSVDAGGARRALKADPRGGSALRRARHVRRRKGERRLGRAGARALARAGGRPRVATTSASRACYFGEGGSIPFMGMLGEKFPKAQFLVTGVLGPHSNAHGPNEFLGDQTAKNLTACVARVLACTRSGETPCAGHQLRSASAALASQNPRIQGDGLLRNSVLTTSSAV